MVTGYYSGRGTIMRVLNLFQLLVVYHKAVRKRRRNCVSCWDDDDLMRGYYRLNKPDQRLLFHRGEVAQRKGEVDQRIVTMQPSECATQVQSRPFLWAFHKHKESQRATSQRTKNRNLPSERDVLSSMCRIPFSSGELRKVLAPLGSCAKIDWHLDTSNAILYRVMSKSRCCENPLSKPVAGYHWE